MNLVAELKRRKVFKVGVAYLVVGWVLIQVAATVGPQLNLPDWAPRLITMTIAQVYASRRQPDKMFEWLDHGLAARDPGVTTVLYAPFLGTYHDDPRFTAFCKKTGLPTTTDAKAMP